MNILSHARLPSTICATLLSVALSGCGGAAGSAGELAPTPVAAADYDDIAAHCSTSKPDPAAPVRDGWITTFPLINNSRNHAATIVSPDGSSSAWQEPIVLTVPISDYRGVTGQFFPSGYGEPSWVMGASFPTVLPKHAVACIVQLPKLKYTETLPYTGADGNAVVAPYSLSWNSYWDATLPIGRLAGYPVDGFEFVSNFVPREGRSFFVLDKSRFASAQGLSICYLAPKTSNWDCVTPSTADIGSSWQVSRSGMQPGAYVLTSATRR